MFLLIQIAVFRQGLSKEMDTLLIKPWLPKLEVEYQAVYHFGDSEWESSLMLICGLEKWYAQIVSGSWSEEGNKITWINNYENLSNVKIDSNRFYSDKTNGEFVIYYENNRWTKGLQVYDSWSNDGQEIGYKSSSLEDRYSGKYSQASSRLLSRDELIDIPKKALKIMRNEIFARYEYNFISGGEMDIYFQSQDWYSGQHDDVSDFLTSLERENIKLIQEIEKLKE